MAPPRDPAASSCGGGRCASNAVASAACCGAVPTEAGDAALSAASGSATAVSNNINISVDPGSYIGDTSVVANLSQTSFMDVTAKSIVKDVTLTNFAGLGQLTTPVINSVATAVGNNVNIGVVVPTP